MSWYDYVPVASNIAGIAKGDPWQGLLGPVGKLGEDAKHSLFDKPAAEQKGAYDQAMALGNSGTQDLMNYYAQQQAQSRAAYKPLQDMFTASYGTKGIKPPSLPGAKPLGAMYGGG